MKMYRIEGQIYARHVMFLISCMLLFCRNGAAQAPDYEWAAGYGGSSEDFSRAVAVDAAGNSYITGSFSGTAGFGGTNLTSNGNHDIFMAKIDPRGVTQWVIQAGSGSPSTEEGRALALDDAGHVYLTGGFSGNANFGTTSLTSAGGLDIFLAKYTVGGDLAWVWSFGGSADFEYGLSVALDSVGNVILTGQFQDAATFGTTNLTSRGGLDIFLAKCNRDGELLWVTQAGGPLADIGRTVVVDAAGASYIAGWFSGVATFGQSATFTSAGSTDAFAAKYDSQGNMVWMTTFATSRGDLGYGFSLDALTNGYFLTWTDSDGGSQLVLQKLNSAGVPQWNRLVRVNSDKSARGSLIADAVGNTWFTSQFTGLADFAGKKLQSLGAGDAFVARYDTSGNLVWVMQAGGPGAEEGRGVAVDGFGGTYLTGRFSSSIIFGALNLTSSGQGDIFLSRLNEEPVLGINHSGSSVVLSWPSAATSLKLQTAGVVQPNDQWQDVAGVPVVIGARYVVTNSLSGSNEFYRLHGR